MNCLYKKCPSDQLHQHISQFQDFIFYLSSSKKTLSLKSDDGFVQIASLYAVGSLKILDLGNLLKMG